MTYTLSDIFIGSFDPIIHYGDSPELYSARYPIRGHNGVDWKMPPYTLILSAADGIVLETGFNDVGYGRYLKVLHDGFLTLYAHLNDVVVEKGDHVCAGQLIAHSDTTGLTFGVPKLHFAVAPCDETGNKTMMENGYGGYIDPLGDDIVWNIKNVTEPVAKQTSILPPITVDPHEFESKTQDSIHLAAIRAFAEQNGCKIGQNGANTAESINGWMAELLEKRIKSDNLVISQTQEVDDEEADETDPILDFSQKHPLAKFKQYVIDWVWE